MTNKILADSSERLNDTSLQDVLDLNVPFQSLTPDDAGLVVGLRDTFQSLKHDNGDLVAALQDTFQDVVERLNATFQSLKHVDGDVVIALQSTFQDVVERLNTTFQSLKHDEGDLIIALQSTFQDVVERLNTTFQSLKHDHSEIIAALQSSFQDVVEHLTTVFQSPKHDNGDLLTLQHTFEDVVGRANLQPMGQGDGGSIAAVQSNNASTSATEVGLASAVVLLDPLSQPLFVNDLPLPNRIDASRPGAYVIQMGESEQWLGLVDADGNPLQTVVWGFGQPGHTATFPGPTIVAYEGTSIKLNWQNKLPVDGHLLPVDTSVHWADPQKKTLADGYVPVVVHLHGGHSPSGSDGLPEAWFTQNNSSRGPDFTDRIYTYPNDQEAATLWYHDHALGITRLNVYAGLAGFYLLRDDNEIQLTKTGVIPGGAFEIEMAIQDRAFTADGQLYYPAEQNDPLPGTGDTVADMLPSDYQENGGTFPTIVPEFFGDFILVNGMAWPNLDVEPGEYRFRMLDGSNSRFYVLQVDNPEVKVTLIGTDGGLLPKAITMIDGIDESGDGLPDPGEQIVLAPGDRVDLVFDFQNVTGESVTLLNIGPAFEPFKGLTVPDGQLAGGAIAATASDSVGQIMQFTVADGPAIDNASVDNGTILNPDFKVLSEADATEIRKLGIFEGTDEFGRIMGQLGVAEDTTDINGNPVPFGPLAWDDPITETPKLGSTEEWQIFNFTEDAHPIHLHQVQFQVLEKQEIIFTDDVANDGSDGGSDGIPDDINHDGKITIGEAGTNNDIFLGAVTERSDLSPEETGNQDTVWVGPGEVLSIIAEFDLPGDYVWHCHILSHEDHEMMRPYQVITDDLVA